jgi:uncharacterized membrane protein YjjP (DUF1212 family)
MVRHSGRGGSVSGIALASLLTMALHVLLKRGMQATFIQKVIICAVAGFAAACLIQWAKVFVEGADKALNGGYEHRTVMGSEKK